MALFGIHKEQGRGKDLWGVFERAGPIYYPIFKKIDWQ